MTTIYVDKSALPQRRAADHYPTEKTLIRATLAAAAPGGPVASILDPGAGNDGRWGLLAADHYRQQQAARPELVGVELRPVARPAGFNQWHQADFTAWQPARLFDLIVGNPPYGDGRRPPLAERFILRAWDLLAPDGCIMFLFRLSMLAGVDRALGLWQSHPPAVVYVLARRPSFYGGRTNATDYGLYVWRKDAQGRPVGQPGQWIVKTLLHNRAPAAGSQQASAGSRPPAEG